MKYCGRHCAQSMETLCARKQSRLPSSLHVVYKWRWSHTHACSCPCIGIKLHRLHTSGWNASKWTSEATYSIQPVQNSLFSRVYQTRPLVPPCIFFCSQPIRDADLLHILLTYVIAQVDFCWPKVYLIICTQSYVLPGFTWHQLAIALTLTKSTISFPFQVTLTIILSCCMFSCESRTTYEICRVPWQLLQPSPIQLGRSYSTCPWVCRHHRCPPIPPEVPTVSPLLAEVIGSLFPIQKAKTWLHLQVVRYRGFRVCAACPTKQALLSICTRAPRLDSTQAQKGGGGRMGACHGNKKAGSRASGLQRAQTTVFV